MLFGKRSRKYTSQNKKLLLYGLQRSGTNFLESLIQLNLPGTIFLNGELRNLIDHKHFRLYDDKSKIPEPQFHNDQHFTSFNVFEELLEVNPDLLIVISKDPYNWLSSYQKWSDKNNWPPHEYHYIEEYNLFYRKWMEFAPQSNRILFVRYIDLLQQPLIEINRIAAALQLPGQQSLRTAKKVYASRKFTQQKKSEFLNQDPASKFTGDELSTINKLVDRELMKFLGYPI